MSSVVAVVKSIIGQVVAVSPEGAQRVLVEGDRIYQGEQLVTGAAGAVTLDTGNGRVIDLGRDSQWSGADLPHAAPAHAQAQLSVPSTEDLQQAIAAGLDPTQALAPTAAGPAASTGGSGAAGGGHSFVMLGETAGRVDPNIGFGTANNGQAFGRQQQEQGNNAQNQRGPNHDPRGQDANIRTDEDTPVSGRLRANDPDGNPLRFDLDDAPRNGTVVVNADGTYTYTPGQNFNGNDRFTVVVNDGQGGRDTITVTVGVNPVNDAPLAANDGPVAVTEDTPATGNVLTNDSDADGDALTVTGFTFGGSSYAAGQTATVNGVGSLVINADGSFTFTPAPNYNGPVPGATYTVSDGQLTDTAQLSFGNVSPANDAPVTADQSQTTAEDTPVSGQIVATDVDQDTLSYTLKPGSEPTHGTLVLNPATGEYTYTPAKDYNGSDSFTVVVSDGNGGSVESVVSIDVTPVNDAPETADQSKTTAEDTPVSGQIVATDVDQDTLSYTLKPGSEPTHGTLVLNPATGEYTYTPAKDYNGSDSFTVVVSDGQGGSVESVVSIDVTPLNDAPETADQSKTTAEDTPVSGQIVATDVDQDTLSYTLKPGSEPTHGTLVLNPATGEYTYTPTKDYNGSDSFTVVVSDGNGGSVESVVSIDVTPVNDAPETNPATASGDEDSSITVNLTGSDIDGTVDHFVIKSLPANGTLMLNGVALHIGDQVPATGNTASVSFTPDANWNGDTSFQFSAVDNLNLEDSTPATATITVNPVNDAPETNPTTASGDEDSSITVNLTGSDIDGTVDHFVIKSLPANGTLMLNGVALHIGDQVPATGNTASVSFTPDANWNGDTSFQFSAVDNLNLEDSTPATATITVNPVNDAPETNPTTASGDEDSSITVNLSGSDIDGTVDHFVIKSLPANGTLMLNGVALHIGDQVPATGNTASVSFTPDANWNGDTSFQFSAVDNLNLADSTPATATITVNPVNDAPETNPATASGDEDSSITVNLTGSDIDGTVDHFVIKSLPANGTLMLNGVALHIGDQVPATGNTASVSFTPDANWNGDTSFQFSAVDNLNLADSTPATATITVTPVNDAPETNPTTASGDEDSSITVNLSGSDIDGTVDHFVIKSLPANGTLMLNGVALHIGDQVPATGNTASVSFTPDANWNGDTSFQFSAVDNLNLADSTPATATITVTPVNDAPETNPTTASGDEDSSITVNLTGSDIDGTVDHFVIKSLPANGTLMLNGVALHIGDQVPATGNTASVSFTPDANWNGDTSFQFSAVDNLNLEDSTPATATITVNPVNDAPETNPATASGDEDSSITVNLSGSDIDGTVDHFVIKSLPANGTLMLNGVALHIGDQVPATGNTASVSFTPDANWNGDTSFQFSAVDNLNLADSTPATATITVNPVNDAPETNPATASGDEDSSITVNLTGSDIDGTVDHFVIKSLPANGTLMLNGVALHIGDQVPATGNTASVSFTPDANWNGDTSFQFSAVDNLNLADSTPATATITVNPVNDAPETNPATASGDEDSSITVNLTGSDIDGTVDHFVIKSLPANGTLMLNGVALHIGDQVPATGNTASVSFTPDANWNGEASFQFSAVDNLNLEDSTPATATITVNPVNDAPETNPTTASGDEDSSITVNLTGSDIDGTVDHFVIKSLPANGTLMLNGVALHIGDQVPATGNTASVSFTPDANWNGEASFQFSAVDNLNLADSTPATATITVNPVNDAPETNPTTASGDEDSSITVNLSGSDIDGTVDHFVIKSLPANGTLMLNGVALHIGDQVPATGNTASVSFTPDANWNGETSFQFSAVDNLNLADSTPATATITVNPVNDAPETNPATASGDEDSSITVNLSGSDIDGTVDHFVIKSLPANGTLMLNGVALHIGDQVPATGNTASVSFTPDANWNGETSFQFSAVDNLNLADSTPATATITVNPVNDAPETNPATASGDEDSSITVNLTGSDIDGTVDHFVIKSLPANGTLMLNGVALHIGDQVPATGNTASVSFTPDANWNGETSFQFSAVDNLNLADSTPATATITVNPVNDAPSGADNSVTLNEDSSRTFSAADFGFTDVDRGDSLNAVRIDGLPGAGSLTLNGVAVVAGQEIAASQLGNLVFTPAANANGSHYADFTFSVKDSAGAFDPTPNTMTLNVTPVNDAPLSTDATANIHIGQTYTFGLNDFAFNDSVDSSNGQLQSLQAVIIKSLPDSGTLWLNGAKVVAGQPVSPNDIASGKLTFVPDAAGSNAHFDFAVQDSGGTANGGVDTSATHGFDIFVGQMQIPGTNPNGDNTLIGGPGDDVILGDVGGTLTITQPGTNYNIALIVDTSGSMGYNLAGGSTWNYADTRMKLVKDALIKLADQLKGHDGVVNIALVGFDSTASIKVSVNDLTDANIKLLTDAIGNSQYQGLQAGGGTNYQAAFGQAVNWFGTVKNGYENVTLFLTDGDPTESSGSGTLMQNTTQAFADLSALSEVRAIGIGTNVNEATLKYFDNTNVTGQGSVTYYKGIPLFDFEGITSLPTDWSSTTDGNGSVSVSGGKLRMMDTDARSGSSTAVSSNLTVEAGKTSTFSFDLTKNLMKGDQFTWTLEKQQADGSWKQVDQDTFGFNDNDGNYATKAVGEGIYRLEFELNDNSDKGKNNNATATIDNIHQNFPVTAPVGQVDIVTQADQLNAALHGGSSSSDLAPVGNDTIHAGAGDDIVFGDSINTDNLPWGVNGNPVKPAELPAGSGVSALTAFLELKNGHVATSEEMYSFIKENHALFNVDGDTRGGSDNLYGGDGNDILYGQGGNDFLFGEGGNDILFGGTGDDQLTGGKGNDILTGGAGADTFIWKAGDIGNDTITDFNAGEGDRIDISDLLPDAAQNDILSYLKVDTTTSTLQVSTTGQVNNGADVTIKLSGVDLSTYGSNPTDIVKQLVAGSDPVVKTEHH